MERVSCCSLVRHGLVLMLETLLAAPAVASHSFLRPGQHQRRKGWERREGVWGETCSEPDHDSKGNKIWFIKISPPLCLWGRPEGQSSAEIFSGSGMPQWKTVFRKMTCVRSACLCTLTHRQEDFSPWPISLGLITLIFGKNYGILESFGKKQLLESFCLPLVPQHDSLWVFRLTSLVCW